jgi:pilus assembly protein CpaE
MGACVHGCKVVGAGVPDGSGRSLMSSKSSPAEAEPPQFVVVTRDAGFAGTLTQAFAGNARISVGIVAQPLEAAAEMIDMDAARVIVADIDAGNRDELFALQAFMMKVGHKVPVLVVTTAFDDAVARWFLQIRVADFLRKPVEPVELLKSCIKAIQAAEPEDKPATCRITSFMPAAGGVGVTTLAIEAALQFMRKDKGNRVCLVDLDFHYGCCADYLDLEPLLDLDEIGSEIERVDLQLLEVMLSRHKSGLQVLAAPPRPAQFGNVNTALVTRLLDIVSSRFDHVIIDLPKHWRPWTDIVLMGSDKVYVVTDMTVPGLRAARRVSTVMNQRLSEQVACEVIVNRFEQNLLFGSGLRKLDIEKALTGILAGTVSNNYRVVREAIDRGVPLEEVKAGNTVSTDLRKLLFSEPAPAKAAPAKPAPARAARAV